MATQSIHPPDLRHITSNPDLLAPNPVHPHRESTHKEHHGHGCKGRPTKLSTGPTGQAATPSKLGTRSPSEIPSSPSSVHSSNSAIFERDIEPLPAALMSTVESINGHSHPPANQAGPPVHHHTLNSQVIENSVPAVLDSAIAALTEETSKTSSDPGIMNIAVISPASPSSHNSGAWTPTGLGSPTGVRTVNISRGASISKPRHITGPSGPSSVVGGSRSPSPTRRSFSVNLPAGIAATAAGQTSPSPGSQSPRIVAEPHRNNSLSTPPIPGAFGGPASPPTSASSANVSPSMSPMSNIMSLSAQDGTASPVVEVVNQSPPLSQGGLSPLVSQASKRLSFVSYSDILNSAPLSTVPFSTIITSDELPPHIPAVLGQSVENVPGSGSSVVGSEGGEWLGGEYEREGFGRGLEARLEAVLTKESDVNGQVALSSVSEPEEDAAIGIAH